MEGHFKACLLSFQGAKVSMIHVESRFHPNEGDLIRRLS